MSLSTKTATGAVSWIKELTPYQWMVFLIAWFGWWRWRNRREAARLPFARAWHQMRRLDAQARQELQEASQWWDKATASNYRSQNREGAEHAEKALAIRQRLLGEEDCLTAASAALAGLLWERSFQLDKARATLFDRFVRGSGDRGGSFGLADRSADAG